MLRKITSYLGQNIPGTGHHSINSSKNFARQHDTGYARKHGIPPEPEERKKTIKKARGAKCP